MDDDEPAWLDLVSCPAPAVGLLAAAGALLWAALRWHWHIAGTLVMIRSYGGMAGLGLLSAAALGAALGWAGRRLITEGTPAGSRITPPAWTARPAQTVRLEIRAETPVTLGPLTVGLAGGRGSFDITASARREADGYCWGLLVVPGGGPEHPAG